jgi:DNA-binding response OmpR family regulator
MNILLVEDEARVADFVRRGLRAEGWSVSVAPTGESALVMIADAGFDLIVLDLMLPGISGQGVCRRLSAKQNRIPILQDPQTKVVDVYIGRL